MIMLKRFSGGLRWRPGKASMLLLPGCVCFSSKNHFLCGRDCCPQKPIQNPHHGESSSNNCHDTSHKMVPMLFGRLVGHSNRTQIQNELGLWNLIRIVVHHLAVLNNLVGVKIRGYKFDVVMVGLMEGMSDIDVSIHGMAEARNARVARRGNHQGSILGSL